MRKDSEKKTKITTIRMTEEQHDILQRKAEQEGISIGCYMVNTSVHGSNHVTPEVMVRIQNLVNTACDAVKETSPKEKKFMEREAKKLWSLLM